MSRAEIAVRLAMAAGFIVAVVFVAWLLFRPADCVCECVERAGVFYCGTRR